jgi:DNA topoisomerase-1
MNLTERACQGLPGQELLQYIDEDGKQRHVSSGDVNAYLREITSRDLTAKDFRTWAGTVLTAMALVQVQEFSSEAEAKRNVRTAIKSVAETLGNTPTVCRKCYVHPMLIDSYIEGSLAPRLRSAMGKPRSIRKGTGLAPVEAAVLKFLRSQFERSRKGRKAPFGSRTAKDKIGSVGTGLGAPTEGS